MLNTLLFRSCRKSERDRAGIWKMQAGLSIIAWCGVLYLAATIAQIVALLRAS